MRLLHMYTSPSQNRAALQTTEDQYQEQLRH